MGKPRVVGWFSLDGDLGAIYLGQQKVVCDAPEVNLGDLEPKGGAIAQSA